MSQGRAVIVGVWVLGTSLTQEHRFCFPLQRPTLLAVQQKTFPGDGGGVPLKEPDAHALGSQGLRGQRWLTDRNPIAVASFSGSPGWGSVFWLVAFKSSLSKTAASLRREESG